MMIFEMDDEENAWVFLENRWMLIVRDTDELYYLYYPHIKYKAARPAKTSYEKDYPAKFYTMHHYYEYDAEKERFVELSKKRAKKLGLYKKL